MDTNETGREPTEPSDAELLRFWAEMDRLRMECAANHSEFDEYNLACIADSNAHKAVMCRGREYLSGARPMPDTPAPDEVAQLRAELDELQKDRDRLYQDRYDLLSVTSTDGLLSSEWVMRSATAERKAKDLKAANTALTARVAELEAELADAKRMVCAVQPSDDHESLYCHDTVFRGVPMNWFDARDKMLSAPGKEPTSE